MLTQKNAKAYAVLAIVYHMLNDDEFEKLTFEPYVNGREIGFSIKNLRNTPPPHARLRQIQAVFSENRNSDQIVVYTGDTIAFSMQGNVPCEETYENARYFAADAYLEAATYVYEYLTK